jgi:ATP-dependent Clp protease adaptor protein ClpS
MAPLLTLAAAAPPVEEQDTDTLVRDAFEKMWSVIVWNDPVNLMSYVVFVFKKVLKMPTPIAHRHMREVHEKGKSLVAQETMEKAEFLVHQLQGFGLQATMERA